MRSVLPEFGIPDVLKEFLLPRKFEATSREVDDF
jgi:hypothetical protein